MTAGEVPPKEVLELLEKEWGVGRHLALALLAHYGGHDMCCFLCILIISRVVTDALTNRAHSPVWDTYQALKSLRMPYGLALDVGLDPLKSSCVQSCLAWRPRGPRRGRKREALWLLATKGFASMIKRFLPILPWRPQAQADLERHRMRETLRLLAVKGFAPIPTE